MSRKPFIALDPLPEGVMVIEASAGTGKTHTLTTLATRFIAERDIRASELLLVTFTRAATAELRDRIRGRLVETAVALGSPDREHGDEVITHLLSMPDDRRRRALDNLTRAIAELDTATISTIHGFAGQALALLGLADEADGGYVDDSGPLTLAVCADVLAAEANRIEDGSLLPKYRELVARTQTVLGRPGLVLRPDPDEAGDARERAQAHLDLVERAVEGVRRQRSRLGQRSYGDILTRLRAELTGGGGDAAARLIRSRYRLALIDEFQDTDPDQWAIFEALFRPTTGTADASNLILVGDPKQAIYAFRGADVHTYVGAVDSVADVRTLDTNWRSDGAVLASVETLLDGVRFGDESIAFHPVSAAPGHRDRRLVDGSGNALPALDLRFVTLGGFEGRDLYNKLVKAEPARRRAFADLAARVRGLLVDGHIPDERSDGDEGATRRVRPGDVAVLVRSSAEAESARDALVAAGIPAVLARGVSVLESAAAEQWRWLLDAVRRPTDPRLARTFALGWFGGHDAVWLDAADDEDLGPLQERLARWAHVLGTDGVDAFIRSVLAESGVIERIIARPDGDRAVTDVEHIGELMRTVGGSGTSGIAGLIATITPADDKVKANPDADRDGDSESRRVESEAEAVQIMTIWVAKGLEFPIVCCPTLWGPRRTGEPRIWLDDDGTRSYDILEKPGWPDNREAKARQAKAHLETDGEALRLLYVALTRARHQTILWWVPGNGSHDSPLARVLFCRDADGVFDPDPTAEAMPKPPTDEDLLGRIRAAIARGGSSDATGISLTEITAAPAPVRWTGNDGDEHPTALAESVLDRVPDRRRGRWSFSSISSRAPDTHDDVDPIDEPAPDPAMSAHLATPVPDPGPEGGRSFDAPEVSPLAPLQASANFGLLVHAIYEHIDFTDAEIAAAVDDRLGRELSWRSIDLTPLSMPDATSADGRQRVIDGVIASLRTPLGADLDDRSLDSFGRRDRLDELDFELHLPGGIDDRTVGRTLLEHLPPDDPQHPWAEQVAAGLFDVELAGHLTGSIDLILRVRRPGVPDRYLVIDYKTNRLHDPAGPPGADDYSPRRLHQEMSRHHYSLQALLYSVALHRYLRWRVPGYDPAANLGGVRYLFVRGMAGPATRRDGEGVHGVCRWDLPAEAVVAVSDLLAGPDRTLPEPHETTPGPAAQGSLFDEVGS